MNTELRRHIERQAHTLERILAAARLGSLTSQQAEAAREAFRTVRKLAETSAAVADRALSELHRHRAREQAGLAWESPARAPNLP